MWNTTCGTWVFFCEFLVNLADLLPCKPFFLISCCSVLVLFLCNECPVLFTSNALLFHKLLNSSALGPAFNTIEILSPSPLKNAVPFSCFSRSPQVFLYGVRYNTVLLVLDHPQEHMAACLHQQPVEAFSLPAWCAPVDLESCQAGCSVRLAHLTS